MGAGLAGGREGGTSARISVEHEKGRRGRCTVLKNSLLSSQSEALAHAQRHLWCPVFNACTGFGCRNSSPGRMGLSSPTVSFRTLACLGHTGALFVAWVFPDHWMGGWWSRVAGGAYALQSRWCGVNCERRIGAAEGRQELSRGSRGFPLLQKDCRAGGG